VFSLAAFAPSRLFVLLIMTLKIITGGQTGADRAAMDAAIDSGIDCGGWCPADRAAEDGRVPERYPVTPLPAGGYEERTRRNVADSDGTVIIAFGSPTGGSETTRLAALEVGKPLLVIDAATTKEAAEKIAQFVRSHDLHVLNVAGPRASEQPKIGAYVYAAIRRTIGLLMEPQELR
jgi:predicted Rossmann-fold nucleotide-binding protein